MAKHHKWVYRETFFISDPMHFWLLAESERRNTTLSGLLRSIVGEYIEREKKNVK